MSRYNVYEYLIYLDEKIDNDGERLSAPMIVAGPDIILARDEAQASITIARAIPEEYEDQLDDIVVVVRPFGEG